MNAGLYFITKFTKYLAVLIMVLQSTACVSGSKTGSRTTGLSLSWAVHVDRENSESISLSDISGYRIYLGNTFADGKVRTL